MQIMSVDASNPGATHDSYIWSTHPLSTHLQILSHTEETWLLGIHDKCHLFFYSFMYNIVLMVCKASLIKDKIK